MNTSHSVKNKQIIKNKTKNTTLNVWAVFFVTVDSVYLSFSTQNVVIVIYYLLNKKK
jgi:hypothetical protein